MGQRMDSTWERGSPVLLKPSGNVHIFTFHWALVAFSLKVYQQNFLYLENILISLDELILF